MWVFIAFYDDARTDTMMWFVHDERERTSTGTNDCRTRRRTGTTSLFHIFSAIIWTKTYIGVQALVKEPLRTRKSVKKKNVPSSVARPILQLPSPHHPNQQRPAAFAGSTSGSFIAAYSIRNPTPPSTTTNPTAYDVFDGQWQRYKQSREQEGIRKRNHGWR